MSHRRLLVAAVSMVAAVTMAACTSWRAEGASPGSRSAPAVASIHKIKHVIVIMMENRSFDSYFGTNEGRIASRRASACQTPGLPNYWAYAQNYVLDDHMFESVRSWSLPSHVYEFSAWSARCRSPRAPRS